jgi:hypothetical protein
MGVDKNSSQKMNLAYAPNLQPKIPRPVCQGRVVTTDLSTLGTNPNSSQHISATQEAKDLGNHRADGPANNVRPKPIGPTDQNDATNEHMKNTNNS